MDISNLFKWPGKENKYEEYGTFDAKDKDAIRRFLRLQMFMLNAASSERIAKPVMELMEKDGFKFAAGKDVIYQAAKLEAVMHMPYLEKLLNKMLPIL